MGKHSRLLIGLAVVAAALLLLVAGPYLFRGKTDPTEKAGIQTDQRVADSLSAIVQTYRKIIVLLEDERTLRPAQREAADVIGEVLFFENQQRLARLTEQLSADIGSAAASGFARPAGKVEEFLAP